MAELLIFYRRYYIILFILSVENYKLVMLNSLKYS